MRMCARTALIVVAGLNSVGCMKWVELETPAPAQFNAVRVTTQQHDRIVLRNATIGETEVTGLRRMMVRGRAAMRLDSIPKSEVSLLECRRLDVVLTAAIVVSTLGGLALALATSDINPRIGLPMF